MKKPLVLACLLLLTSCKHTPQQAQDATAPTNTSVNASSNNGDDNDDTDTSSTGVHVVNEGGLTTGPDAPTHDDIQRVIYHCSDRYGESDFQPVGYYVGADHLIRIDFETDDGKRMCLASYKTEETTIIPR